MILVLIANYVKDYPQNRLYYAGVVASDHTELSVLIFFPCLLYLRRLLIIFACCLVLIIIFIPPRRNNSNIEGPIIKSLFLSIPIYIRKAKIIAEGRCESRYIMCVTDSFRLYSSIDSPSRGRRARNSPAAVTLRKYTGTIIIIGYSLYECSPKLAPSLSSWSKYNILTQRII